MWIFLVIFKTFLALHVQMCSSVCVYDYVYTQTGCRLCSVDYVYTQMGQQNARETVTEKERERFIFIYVYYKKFLKIEKKLLKATN